MTLAKSWRVTTLGALCAEGGGGVQTGPFGSQLHAADYVAVGVPSVMPQNIGDNTISADGIAMISDADAERLSKYRLRVGDIVYSRRGDVEKRAYVRPANDGWLCGTGCLRVRLGDAAPHDSQFISYQLGTAETRAWIVRHAVGATMPNLNTTILSNVPISLPSLSGQRGIAEVLGALDAKIAANTKLGSLLGKHVDAAFASIVGPWRNRVALGDLVSITKGVSYRSVDLVPSSTALVTLKSIQRDGSYSPRGLKAFAGAFKDVQKLRVGDLVVAQTDLTQAADVVGRAVRVPASSRFDTLVASLDIAIVRAMRGVESEFVLGVMRDQRFIEHCKSRTSGTTVLHLGKDAVQSFLAPEVSFELQQRYAAEVGPAHHMRDAVERESELLATTRDALLPLLMSGKIQVKDAEQMVGDVV